MPITTPANVTKVLNALSADRFWTAGSVANRAGVGIYVVKALLEEFAADGVVISKPFDCTRMTYKLAA